MNQKLKEDLLEAKRKLYHALLCMPNEYLESSESDLHLMDVLVKDGQIQGLLDRRMEKDVARWHKQNNR